MKIANIMGLHLGCMVRAYNYKHELYSINREGFCYLDNIKTSERVFAKPENCKLILKPLSKITDEDKAEFFKEFDGLKHLEKDFSGINSIMGICELVIENKSHRFKVSLTGKVSLWLCSKGYDIGLVPDEYKEVEE